MKATTKHETYDNFTTAVLELPSFRAVSFEHDDVAHDFSRVSVHGVNAVEAEVQNVDDFTCLTISTTYGDFKAHADVALFSRDPKVQAILNIVGDLLKSVQKLSETD